MRYEMLLDCGCCTDDTLEFVSDEAALEAIRNVGLGNGMTVMDSNGVKHEGLDTFYGIWRASEDNS